MKFDETENVPPFMTSDLGLAASLATLNYPIQAIDASNPSKVIFQFTAVPDIHHSVELYWAGALKLEPKNLFFMLRQLKARIKNETELRRRA